MQNLSKPLGYHSDVHGWRWNESLLAKECLNISIDKSEKNINIKTHPANNLQGERDYSFSCDRRYFKIVMKFGFLNEHSSSYSNISSILM